MPWIKSPSRWNPVISTAFWATTVLEKAPAQYLTDRQLPDQGTVTVDGQPVRNNEPALHKVFMVGEQNFFPEDMKTNGHCTP